VTLLASAFPLIDNLQWGLGRQATAGTGRLAFARDGSGRMLIFPFSSTQGGNATLINVVNAEQGRGKAVKVRYRGASNADAIFDLQLFLAPGDASAVNVSRGPNGVSRLFTVDRSCTLPAAVNVDFGTARLTTEHGSVGRRACQRDA